jgi:hypothetical protein
MTERWILSSGTMSRRWTDTLTGHLQSVKFNGSGCTSSENSYETNIFASLSQTYFRLKIRLLRTSPACADCYLT